jgi:AmmeMemoRadiSam system protein A
MDSLGAKDKEYLLSIAKHSISFYLERGRKPDVKDIGFQGASFVTLMKKGELRGCIGTLEARQDLAGDVSENAMNAAFGDPRFGAVSKGELNNLNVEVSVLTPKERFNGTEAEFAAYISKEKCGVIIERGWNRATFLPDVWKTLPSVNEFLTELSYKAGLGAEGWKSCERYTYRTIAFSKDWAKIKEYK